MSSSKHTFFSLNTLIKTWLTQSNIDNGDIEVNSLLPVDKDKRSGRITFSVHIRQVLSIKPPSSIPNAWLVTTKVALSDVLRRNTSCMSHTGSYQYSYISIPFTLRAQVKFPCIGMLHSITTKSTSTSSGIGMGTQTMCKCFCMQRKLSKKEHIR